MAVAARTLDVAEIVQSVGDMDPGKTTEQHASDRAKTLVNELNGGGRRVITAARDKLDDLQRALNARGDMLIGSINEYAALVQSSVEMAGIIMEPIDRLAKAVGDGVDQVPGRTITQG